MILVTGGAGYIGTHTLIELHNANCEFVVYDNLSNSSEIALKKIINKNINFVKGDKYSIDSVIHFAVGESVANPLK